MPRSREFLRPLSVIDQWRKAIHRGDIEEYRRLAGPCWRSLRHNKNQWAERVACAGENHLLCGEIKDAFANFQLRHKCVTLSAPLKSANGNLLSDRESVEAEWQEYFGTLLNWSSLPLPFILRSEARASTPYPLIDSSPPTNIQSHDQDESR